MESWAMFITVAVIVLIIAAVVNANDTVKRINEIKRQLADKGFKPANTIMLQEALFAINVEKDMYCLGYTKSDNIVWGQLSSILDYEIITNGTTVYKKSGTLGRAIVGGALLGGVGAIIGASSADRKAVTNIRSANIKILLNNVDDPSFLIKIFDENIIVEATKITYMENARLIIDKLTVVSA